MILRALVSFAFAAIPIVPVAAGMPVPHAAATAPALRATAIVAKMVDRNPSLASYRARVHVDVRMLNFPFLAPKLDGTSYFKRPDNYEVVFDRVPRYAKGFSKLFDDVGDPGSWTKDNFVTYVGEQSLNDQPVLVLRLVKKIHSSILDQALAFVDPNSFELLQMEWYYTSGGKIVMTQRYRSEGGYTVLSAQHATISIPHVRAVADSSYGTYQTNVAVDGAVFVKP